MKQYQSSLMTKQELADALKDLMSRKPFSRITVTDITKSCDFNRKTFYYHFDDTISLLHWMLAREAVEVVKGYDMCEPTPISSTAPTIPLAVKASRAFSAVTSYRWSAHI